MISLPRSAPSTQGVDPVGILAFLDAVAFRDMEMHSLMLLRHGHVVAEGWWSPYRPDRVHLLYSLSKSFTATAIGIAEAEGLLSISDRIVDYFPDKVPAHASPFTRAMRVRDLLAMASGHAKDTLDQLVAGGEDVVRTFLSLPPEERPGSLFCYNQGCTYTLSAIITKLTRGRLLDYLRPRLLDPLGIEAAEWVQFRGIDPGFSGLHVVTESVAKLGLLHLQDGAWQDGQLVPTAFVADARRKQSDSSEARDSPDWQQGYGYQFWLCRHDAFRGEGAFGQFCIMVPAADAVIVCTAREPDMQAQIDLIWEHLLPALSGDAAPVPDAEGELSDRLATLTVRPLDANSMGPNRAVAFVRTETPAPDTGPLISIRVEPAGEATLLTVVSDGAEQSFELVRGQWTEGRLPGLHASLESVAVSGGWVAPDEFAADAISLHAPHRLRLRAAIADQPTVEVSWYQPPLR